MEKFNGYPPRFVLNFFRWYCHPKMLDYIEGDLMEVYHVRLKTLGKRKADIKFIVDVLLLFRPGIIRPMGGYQNLNNYGVYQHYFKISVRNLWKNKAYSALNILGLAAGTLCCLYILIYIQEQYSFDNHHRDADRIFRLATDIISSDNPDRIATISPGILPAVQKDFPEVEAAVRVVNRADVNEHLFRNGDKSFYITKGYYADSTFFNLFDYQFTEGTIKNCLDQPLSMVISSDVAKKLFGNESAVNKIITMTDRFGTNDFAITGVFDERYGRSHLRPNFIMNIYSGRLGDFIREDDKQWAGQNYVHGYIKLKPETDGKTFEAKLNSYIARIGKEQFEVAGYTKNMHLQSIQDIHVSSRLNQEIDKNSDSKFLFILFVIAAFIQAMACINFMNLSTARAASRAKEIGVRKSAGAGNASIIKQFLGESLLITGIAIGLALPLLYVLLPYFNNISRYSLSTDIFSRTSIWCITIALCTVTALLAGSYPAFYLSSLKVTEVLKGKISVRLSGVSLRKGLVVFQFLISIGLVIAAMVIRSQVTFMQGKELGFIQEQKLVIPIRSRASILNIESFKNEVAGLAEVEKVAGVAYYLGFKLMENIDLYMKGQTITDAKQILYNQADENYFETMGISLIAGRNFTKADTLDQVIINETAAKALGLVTADAPGQRLQTGSGNNVTTYNIVGVTKDFNFLSLHEVIKPLFFRYNNRFPNLIVSSRTSDYPILLAKLQRAWRQFSPQEPFEFFFLNENIQKQYEMEDTLLRIVKSFTMLAIFICCLGLFGLAAFTAEQRAKEIGIRKIMGATTGSLVTLLSKDFLWLVLIACVIITPVAWWAMSKWLQDFAYRINVSWWLFAFSAAIALLIALVAISFQAIKAATANPVKSLRSE